METIPDKLLLEIYHQARLYKLSNDFIELLEKEIVARKLMDRVIDKKLS
ncbi:MULTISPECIES: sporulation histidine kinase inhibitor Sda [Gracilibacillus]|uniref:Sporulation histidine kinase inhibitor Sda n=1 Tax=Gracilibacillus dipsosauri TaxID=178340 RepID=A0A317KUU7_9BACI|nr:sporulation histidine kinase inhibitor Sda [Gracilibacillus dipsosauri]PWU67331.1 sporulation histidine kinase inhibitor Sda [Gracilibacillus dipsosauri]